MDDETESQMTDTIRPARMGADLARSLRGGPGPLNIYLTVDEAAAVLRTTRKAIYALIERGLIPGVRRVGRRILVRQNELIEWIESKAAKRPA